MTYWSVWAEGNKPYNGEMAITGGSAYVDVAVLRLGKPTTWWYGLSYTCGYRAMHMRTCGYPGDKGGDTQWCSDGYSQSMDYCDAVTDYVTSYDAYVSPGQSGGPVFDFATGWVTAVNSGSYSGVQWSGLYAALDRYCNWQLFEWPDVILWTRSRK